MIFDPAKSIITNFGSSSGVNSSKKLFVELKKSGPSISYTFAPLSVLDALLLALIFEAVFQA